MTQTQSFRQSRDRVDRLQMQHAATGEIPDRIGWIFLAVPAGDLLISQRPDRIPDPRYDRLRRCSRSAGTRAVHIFSTYVGYLRADVVCGDRRRTGA
jgi:hypothetical protein